MADLGYLDVETIDGRSSFVSHPTLEFLAADFQEIADEFLGSRRSDDLMAPRSSLVPRRDDELKQVDHMIRMQMRQKQEVYVRSGCPGGEKSLGDP